MAYTSTNKGISGELQGVPNAPEAPEDSSPALTMEEVRVLAWLKMHASTIVLMEKKYNIDRRAIAGAIAWEALENVKSSAWLSLWSGAGKIHTWGLKRVLGISFPSGKPSLAEETEKEGYIPSQGGYKQRFEALKNPATSIAYIAAMMRAGVDIAEENGFLDMNQDPIALTEFYQGWDLMRWRVHMKAKKKGTYILGKDSMCIWVSKNLAYLEDCVGASEAKPMSISARISSTGPKNK